MRVVIFLVDDDHVYGIYDVTTIDLSGIIITALFELFVQILREPLISLS